MISLPLLFVLFFSALLLCPSSSDDGAAVPTGGGAAGDELTLLSFKSSLLYQGGACRWHLGTRPATASTAHRWVLCAASGTRTSSNLSGIISPSLGNLSFPRKLELSDNHLSGKIPQELSRLQRLSLYYNSLSGEIPGGFGQSNQSLVSGAIPSSLGKLTSLIHLALAENMLSGSIPSSLGQLPGLSFLSLAFNNLSGAIPDPIWNISSLVEVYIYYNQFHSRIPASMGNASNISIFTTGFSTFRGVVPQEIGRLGNLQRLELEETLLEAKDTNDWKFMTALTNCSNLQEVELGGCKFGGVLPDSVSNLSSSLTTNPRRRCETTGPNSENYKGQVQPNPQQRSNRPI
uniref:non-specific serine/threonine protein kinase n=1 Tax=Oryza punctata TaxID=4537 RepID=A0A0E0MGG1_ORYPU